MKIIKEKIIMYFSNIGNHVVSEPTGFENKIQLSIEIK